MKTKLFKSIYVVCIMVFALTAIFTIGTISRSFAAVQTDNLKAQADMIEAVIEREGIDALKGITTGTGFRVTVVEKSGEVLYDSIADTRFLGNHIEREEIREAFEAGEGTSTRYSETVSGTVCYYARLMESGNVLRLSSTEFTLGALIPDLFTPFLVITILAIAIAVCIAYYLSNTVTEPINNIDAENPDERDVYDELKPFVRRINKQNRQLQAQMEQIKIQHNKQDKLRREFTANVSHELKTPLTSISGYAEIMRDGLVKEEDISEFSGRIYDEAQRLISLVGDIIELSQLEDKDTKLNLEQLNLKAVCEDTAKRLSSLADKRGITININADDSMIFGCRPIIEEIVFNLCDNAVKYNKDGGRVDIILKDNALTVKDTGIGIEEKELERVFERFYRVDKSHSRKIGGTGLGLSIVKHGANAHNARIDIKSRINEGTEITLIFKKQ